MKGSRFAGWAVGLSALTLSTSIFWHYYRYSSETLPGYERVAFNLRKPNELAQYSDHKVCLTGYILTLDSNHDFSRVLFSPDGDFRRDEGALSLKLHNGTFVDERGKHFSSFEAVAVSGILKVKLNPDGTLNSFDILPHRINPATSRNLLLPTNSDC